MGECYVLPKVPMPCLCLFKYIASFAVYLVNVIKIYGKHYDPLKLTVIGLKLTTLLSFYNHNTYLSGSCWSTAILKFIIWVCEITKWNNFKGSRTGHSVKVSLWYASLLTNTRFDFLYFRISNWCYIKTKSFQMTQVNQVIIIFPIKSKMAAAKKQSFLRFRYWTESSSPSFKVCGFTHDYKFGISVNTYQ